MKKFIKENWFKLGLLLILALGVFVFYQDNKKTPNTEKIVTETRNEGTNIVLAKQCREDGEKLLQEDKETATRKKQETGVVDCYYMEPHFIFNSDLDTCLYSGGYTCDLLDFHKEGILKGEHVKQWERHIIDVYTNKTLEFVYVEDSSDVPSWKQEEITNFWNKSSELGF